MRVGTLAVAVLLSASAVAPFHGQTGSQTTDSRFIHEHGELLVWRVVAVSPPRPFTPASLDPHVKTETAGSFGQTAGSFGQTAGSAGQTASSIGQPSSNTGQTAGSTGKTAGSFGESLSTIAAAAERSNGTAVRTKSDTNWDRFTQSAQSEFRSLNVVYEEVGADELESKLQERSPDVIVGTPLPASWSDQDTGLVRRYGLVTLGVARPFPQEETPEPLREVFRVEASILRAAPNPSGARDFVLWLYDRELYSRSDRVPAESQTPAALAKSALFDTLNGQRMGTAGDREAAPFNAALAQQIALNASSPTLLADLKVRVDVMAITANERFADVALRAVVENSESFGVVHALVVLRTDDVGHWHVLQITPNLRMDQQNFAWGMLRDYGTHVNPESVATVLGVAQASPTDGDNRESPPELWWDNRGGATLEIVEWQRKADESWTNSNLFFVPDDTGHLRTRVTGRFANFTGPCRWRIWSVGRGGVVAISPWRALNIVSH
jgi:hypothetical protein